MFLGAHRFFLPGALLADSVISTGRLQEGKNESGGHSFDLLMFEWKIYPKWLDHSVQAVHKTQSQNACYCPGSFQRKHCPLFPEILIIINIYWTSAVDQALLLITFGKVMTTPLLQMRKWEFRDIANVPKLAWATQVRFGPDVVLLRAALLPSTLAMTEPWISDPSIGWMPFPWPETLGR